MKKMRLMLGGAFAAALALACGLLLVSCETPSYPSEAAASAVTKKTFTSRADVTINDVSSTLPSDFMRGFDASMVYAVEKAGGVYYNENDEAEDIFNILKRNGVNWIRLRVWNDPDWTDSGSQGWNDLNVTKTLAVRAKAAGMKLLLDFHYSDTWADPTNQKMPAAWADLSSADDVADALRDYTYDVLQTLCAAGAAPDMVQLGNENEVGLFLSGSKNGVSAAFSTTDATDQTKANFAAFIKAGALAVRQACPDAKTALHFSRGGDYSKWSGVLTYLLNTSGLDSYIDAVGLSYYTYWNTHLNVSSLQNAIQSATAVFGKEVFVAETSYGWIGPETADIYWSDDGVSNEFYTKHEVQACANIGSALLNDSANAFETALVEKGDSTYSGQTCLPGSVQNQASVTRAIIDATASVGGSGVFYWGGDWIKAVPGNYENQALFDFDGKVLPSIKVFSVSSN